MTYIRKREPDFRKAQKNKDWPVVISEGDSWFSYSDVIGRLDDPNDKGPAFQRRWALLRLEKNGDEILSITSGAQRADLRKFLDKYKLDAFLFSGGGNDIIGPDLLPLLRVYSEGMNVQDLIAYSRFERRLRQIQDCYRELLDLFADYKQKAKIFVNSYDYPKPSNEGVRLIGCNLLGPWLLPYLAERNIPVSFHEPIVKILIDSFASAIDVVATEPRGHSRLIRVETRGIVRKDWKDEIHPNRDGAIRVAKEFEKAMRKEGIAV